MSLKSLVSLMSLGYARAVRRTMPLALLVAEQVAVYGNLLGVAHLLALDIREFHAELLGLTLVDLAR